MQNPGRTAIGLIIHWNEVIQDSWLPHWRIANGLTPRQIPINLKPVMFVRFAFKRAEDLLELFD